MTSLRKQGIVVFYFRLSACLLFPRFFVQNEIYVSSNTYKLKLNISSNNAAKNQKLTHKKTRTRRVPALW